MTNNGVWTNDVFNFETLFLCVRFSSPRDESKRQRGRAHSSSDTTGKVSKQCKSTEEAAQQNQSCTNVVSGNRKLFN